MLEKWREMGATERRNENEKLKTKEKRKTEEDARAKAGKMRWLMRKQKVHNAMHTAMHWIGYGPPLPLERSDRNS